MTEKEYRIERLKHKKHKLQKKRIVIYGTGINAEAVLKEFPEWNILAVMDERHTGEYWHGKKVISLEEAVILGIEVIIIAAEASSSYIVSKRLFKFCLKYDISLFNMYGYEEIELRARILEQDLKYVNRTEEELKKEINVHDVICFQLIDVLCVFSCVDNELFGRILPKVQLIDIVNWSAEQGKKIYIISELGVAKEETVQLLDELGIGEYKGIVQENIQELSFSQGAIRKGLGKDFIRKCLYVGTDENNHLFLPQVYGMDIYLVKNAWDIKRQFLGLKGLKEEDLIKKNELIQYTFNSPFMKDNGYIDLETVSVISDGVSENKEFMDGLFTLPVYTELRELEKLEFQVRDKPLVSIIIPVHNQFSYTYNCLKTVLINTKKIEYEIILADDFSNDDTRRIEEIVKGIKVIHNESNLSFLKNCNQAAGLARGKYLLFLNNDTQVRRNWLYSLVWLMEHNSDAGLVGSKFLYPNGRIQEAGGIIWNDGTASNYGRGKVVNDSSCNYVREVDYISGASIIITKELWKEIGGFDERYAPAYCEDSDLAFEVRKRNKKVLYQPASEVVHFEGISNGRDVNKGIRSFQKNNIYKLRNKWKSTLEKEQYNPGHFSIAARDRKGSRKCAVFIGRTIQTEDSDVAIYSDICILKLLLKKDYLLKYLSLGFEMKESYISEIQQMGIEVVSSFSPNYMVQWILENQKDIDYVFLNILEDYTWLTEILNCTKIQLCYFGYNNADREIEGTGFNG